MQEKIKIENGIRSGYANSNNTMVNNLAVKSI